jgi:hypothetical protein
MPPPYVAVVRVKPAERYPTLAASMLNERAVEVIGHQQAPDPPRQGDTPARIARMPIFSSLARRQIRSVMAEHQAGVMGKKAFDLFVSSPQGKSLTWDERVNIRHGSPEAFGSRFQISPQMADEIRLQTLMGV